MSHTERVVVLVDMDCFYCQVEEKLDPNLEGKPIAVVQYNAWRGGGIIAVNYPARDKGVTRHMRGNEAKQKCPEIVLARVPEVRGKADLTKYRDAGKQVADVLQTFTKLLERASVDEAYLDITEEVKNRLEQGLDQIKIEKLANTFVVGYDTFDFIKSLKDNTEFSESNIRLAIGGIITEEIRAEIFKKTGYKCSAGVAHNKILAKLVCGLHKPNKQTLLPQNSVSELYKDLPIKKIKSLGGKFGNALAEELQITYMGELLKFSEKELVKKFDEKNAKWLYNIARGIDLESVTVRLISKSIGCCKRFPGRTALVTSTDVEHWMNELASEISERLNKDLEENNRRAKQMVVSFTQETDGKDVSSSRTHPLQSYEQQKIARSALDVIRRFCLRADGSYYITFLGLSVGNFQDLKNSVDITSLFKNMNQNESPKLKPLQEDKPKNMPSFFQNIAEKTQNLNINSTSDPIKTDEEETSSKKMHVTKPKSFFQSWAAGYQEPATSKAAPSIDTFNKETISGLNPSLEKKQSTHLDEKENVNVTENIKPSEAITKSFFLNYFMTEGKHLLKRKTNTIVSENNPCKLHEETSQDGSSMQDDKIENIQSESTNEMESCPECGKKIPISNYLSHLDYHFALKMVKEEAHLYKEPKANSEREPTKIKNSNKTKEVKEPGRVLTLLQKSKKEELDENNSELCAECNKRIRISDLSRHFDKHEEEKTVITDIVREPNSKKTIGDHSDQLKLERGHLEHVQSEDRVSQIHDKGICATKDMFAITQFGKSPIKTDYTESVSLGTDKMDFEEPSPAWETEGTSKILPAKESPNIPKHSNADADLFSDGSLPHNENLTSKQDPEETDNLSVYSADTEDLNEETKNLIYFEDVFSESDSSQPLFKSQETKELSNQKNYMKKNRTSCVKDAFLNLDFNRTHYKEPDKEKLTFSKATLVVDNDKETEEEPKSSVRSSFVNYFEKYSEKKNVGNTEGMNDGATEEPKELMEVVPEIDGNHVCPECNKIIPSSGYLSHLDYHFALKMVQDEAHLYKNTGATAEEKPPKMSSKKNKSAQTSKRKLPECKNIETFLQKPSVEDLDENNSEICRECNKRIKLDETVGHADYHAAKKLHSELSSPKKVMTTSVKVTSKKNKSVMNMKTISNFFKA